MMGVRVDSAERLRKRMLLANIEALDLAGKTKNAVLEATPKGRFVRLPDGNPALELEGRIIGAPADLRSSASSLADVEDTQGGVAVVFGIGAGHAVRELRDRSSAKLVVYEPDPGVLRMVLESGPCDLGGIPILCDPHDLESIWTGLALDRPSAALVRTPGYEAAYPQAASALAETIRMLVADVSLFANTRAFRFRNWLEDVVANLDVLCEATPFTALAEQYRGVPAFIIGAGPSLKRNVELLREAVGRGIVLAVDVSGKVLAAHGIEPQVLVCLEALNLSKHIDSLPFIDRVVRAFSLTASPASLKTGKGPLLPFYEGLRAFEPLVDLLEVPSVSVGGSVSTVAFSIAEKLGCSPIVLLGQDLAYTDGRTHAEGTAFEASRANIDRSTGMIVYDHCKEIMAVREGSGLGPPQSREALFEVPAWGGSGVATSTAAFNAYRKWFEGAADAIHTAKPDVRLINATEGGSHIRGFEEVPLVQVLEGLPARDISSESLASAAKKARSPLSAERIREWADRQAERAHAVKESASALAETTRRARKALDGTEPSKISALFRELARMEETFREVCAGQPFLEGWSYAQMHNLLLVERERARSADTGAEAAQALETEVRMAEVLETASADLARALEDVSKRMSSKTTMAR